MRQENVGTDKIALFVCSADEFRAFTARLVNCPEDERQLAEAYQRVGFFRDKHPHLFEKNNLPLAQEMWVVNENYLQEFRDFIRTQHAELN